MTVSTIGRAQFTHFLLSLTALVPPIWITLICASLQIDDAISPYFGRTHVITQAALVLGDVSLALLCSAAILVTAKGVLIFRRVHSEIKHEAFLTSRPVVLQYASTISEVVGVAQGLKSRVRRITQSEKTYKKYCRRGRPTVAEAAALVGASSQIASLFVAPVKRIIKFVAGLRLERPDLNTKARR